MIDLTKLSDKELVAYKQKISFDASKYKNLQLAKKVQLNAAYGALGNEYFRFFDVRQAEAVTISGQFAIRWIERDLNLYLNKVLKTENVDYVIAADTDSVYLNLSFIVDAGFGDKPQEPQKVVDFLDKFSNQGLQKEIERSYNALADYVNAFSQKMRMKRESIADRGIWTSKKRYIMNVYDAEGVRYTTPKLKIMGIEAIKSSTPQYCRDKIKEAIKLILNKSETDLHSYIQDVEKEFKNLPPEEVSFPRSCNGLMKYFDHQNVAKSGTPIHVRGSLIYNKLVKEKKLTKKYPLIQDGNKIRFLYLKEPNPVQSHVLSIVDGLPEEFSLEKYIDYDIQFDKAFKEPLRSILDAIGWGTEKKRDLSSFFIDG